MCIIMSLNVNEMKRKDPKVEDLWLAWGKKRGKYLEARVFFAWWGCLLAIGCMKWGFTCEHPDCWTAIVLCANVTHLQHNLITMHMQESLLGNCSQNNPAALPVTVFVFEIVMPRNMPQDHLIGKAQCPQKLRWKKKTAMCLWGGACTCVCIWMTVCISLCVCSLACVCV